MKTAVLTTSWDDGHRRDVRLARMLKEHGLKATFYVAPENQEFAKQDLLSLPEIRELSQDFEIGAHSMTHRRLPTLSEQEATREIIESKAVLEQVIGKEIKVFCYPGGAYTGLHMQLVKDAGYRYARTVEGTHLQWTIPTRPELLCMSITTGSGSTYGRPLGL